MKQRILWTVLSSWLLFAMIGAADWYKGGLHMHSLWSDGDAAPEIAVNWYKEKGWHFVCLTDHNALLEGDVFKPITEEGPLTERRVQALRDAFGEDWTQAEERAGRLRMRLKTFSELAARFDEPGSFLLMHGEEITTFGGSPHVGAVHVSARTGGVQAGDVADLTNKYMHAVALQDAEDRPCISVLNHVNFADGVRVEEALCVKDLRFFEVYNGHPSVNNWGHEGKGYPSTDRFWDIVMSLRLLSDPGFCLYGLATDDAHNYFEFKGGAANPGRGWVMVRAEALTPASLIQAMRRGDFYASTGVVIEDIERSPEGLALKIAAEPGIVYTTRFLGTRRGFDPAATPVVDGDGAPKPRASQQYSAAIGEVLLETTDVAPRYAFTGDELYVRATVISSKPQPNPFREGDVEMAWVQPVLADNAMEK